MAYEDPALGSGEDGSTAQVAKEQAGRVGQTAAEAGTQVAQTTKEQAQNVVGEAKQQARDLVGEARTQARDQAGAQKGRAVQGLRAIGDELDQMSQQSGQSGLATEVARQASSRAHDLAEYLDRHEPADLLEQVRSYARRRPVVFLTGAAIAGVVAGRLTRGLASKDDSSEAPAQLYGDTPQALPVGEPVSTYGTGYAPVGTPEYVTPGQPAYGAPAYQPSGYDPGYPTPAAPTPSYETPGYGAPDYGQPDYRSPGGFRAPDEVPGGDPAGYPPSPERSAGFDPAYGEENPPARGWTP